MYNCASCGKEFNGYRYGDLKFCGKECANRSIRKMKPKKRAGVNLTCLNCRAEFYAPQCKKNEKKFCSRDCMYNFMRTTKAWGFERSEVPRVNNPYKRVFLNGKYHREHRLLMEKHLGRSLLKSEHVHHINGNPRDNRLENLDVLDAREHLRLHKSRGVLVRPPTPGA